MCKHFIIIFLFFGILVAQRYNLSGKVVNGDGVGVKKAIVSIVSDGSPIKEVNTNRTGKFKFKKIPYGEYTLKVSHDEFVTEEFWIRLTENKNLDNIKLVHQQPGITLMELNERAIKEKAWPGGVLLASKDGKIFFKEAFGYHTYKKIRETRTSDIFDLASITKVIVTTSAIMKLYEEGKIQLDDPVVKYLPEFKGRQPNHFDQKSKITIRNLITHTGGLAPFKQFYLMDSSIEGRLDSLYNSEPETKIGEKVVYSDIGLITMGKLVEKVWGLTLDKIVDSLVFKPLGMNSTFYNPPKEKLHRIVPTEISDQYRIGLIHGEVHDENAHSIGGVAGHAGLFSTARDLARFSQMMLNRGIYDWTRIFKAETVDLFTQRANIVGGSSRCLGWDSPDGESSGGVYLSDKSFGHTGYTGTSLWIDPENQITVILLTNAVHPNRSWKKPKYFDWRQRIHSAVYEALGFKEQNPNLKLKQRWVNAPLEKIKQLSNPIITLSNPYLKIEKEAKLRYPYLFLPQDEFETTAEYTQRIAQQQQTIENVELDLIAEETAKESEAERLLQIRIAESLAPVELFPLTISTYNPENGTFSLGISDITEGELNNYINAESGTFPLTVGGQTYTVKIPRSEARDFKEHYRTAKVEGYKQLQRDLETYDYFNMVAIHPITGSRFPFGPTKDIAAAPVIAGRKAVGMANLTMRVAFVEPNSNGFLDAEEKGKVKVSITNSGQGSAMGVFVKLNAETSNRDITAGTSNIIGEIPAGQTKTTEFEINASKSVTRMENRFTVSATESYGFPPDPAQITFETFPFIPPKLELVDFGVSTPNEGNEIRPATTTEVQARVQNRGQGSAEDVKFSINLPKGVYFTPDSRQEYSFSALKPGEFKDLVFSFYTNREVGDLISISIGFTEESTTEKFPLDLDVAKPQQTIQQLVVLGQEMGTVEFADVATVSVDIEKDIPISGRKGKNDLAIVFGIESYKNVPGVSFAKRDAEWMKKYFENVLGIPKNRIHYKTDSDASLAEFNVAFGGWLKKRLKDDSNIFIYYAGHGAPDMKENKAYLIPYDGNPNYASDTGFEMDALYEQLGNLGAASVTVFLDACFSGANRDNEMLLADARPVFMEVDESATRNVTVFSAAGGKEISSAWPEKKHGLFSYFLMKGMRGDADTNKDNQITVGELGDYVKENVSDMAGMLDREQTPGLQTLDKEKVLISY